MRSVAASSQQGLSSNRSRPGIHLASSGSPSSHRPTRCASGLSGMVRDRLTSTATSSRHAVSFFWRRSPMGGPVSSDGPGTGRTWPRKSTGVSGRTPSSTPFTCGCCATSPRSRKEPPTGPPARALAKLRVTLHPPASKRQRKFGGWTNASTISSQRLQIAAVLCSLETDRRGNQVSMWVSIELGVT